MNADFPEPPQRPLLPFARYGDPWIRYRLSWGSVIAGAFVATGIHVLLTAIETSFGMVGRPAVRIDYMSGFTVAAGIAGVVNAFVSLWIGGWMAGRTSGHGYGNVGGLHGITVWAVTTTAAYALLPRLGSLSVAELVNTDNQVLPPLAAGAHWRFLTIAVGAFAAGWGGRHGALRGGAFHRET
jgi:hypothetical protein